MKNKTSLLITLLIAVPLSAALAADRPGRGQLSSSDFQFAREAAQGGQFELNAGRLASEKAVLPAVKQFGEQMVSDHGKMGDKLKNIAANNQASLPTELTAKHQREIDRLSRLSGMDFDKAYTSLMVSDHRKDLKEFQKAARQADDADLKAFAAESAPIIESHLSMAKNLEEQAKSQRARR
jgi:putative membrane protein